MLQIMNVHFSYLEIFVYCCIIICVSCGRVLLVSRETPAKHFFFFYIKAEILLKREADCYFKPIYKHYLFNLRADTC